MKPKTAHIFHVTLEGWCYVENDSSQMNPKSCRSAGRPGSANRQSVGTGILSLNVVGLGLSRLRGAQGGLKNNFFSGFKICTRGMTRTLPPSLCIV